MPDANGMVTEIERKTWGILGRPPDGFWSAPDHLQKAWKDLAEEAKRVGRMHPKNPDKTAAAKRVEEKRQELCDAIRQSLS